MPAWLEVTIGNSTRRVTCGPIVTVGRDASNTIQVKDPLISRNHALIRNVGRDQYYVLDVGSRNGSFVNDIRIATPTLLRTNDLITLGNTKLLFKQLTEEEAPAGDAHDLGETISYVRSDIRPVAILVADIRGYTTLSEQVPITVLSSLMSKWFTNVQGVIDRHGGRIDKFIGDCVMALWDAGGNAGESVRGALRAGLDIQRLTRDLSFEYPDIREPLRIGVGINTGMAALGIGAESTAMGDTVNLAFRLETATKALGRDVVVSDSTYCHLPIAVWRDRTHTIEVKGKSAPIKVAALTFAELQEFLDSEPQPEGKSPAVTAPAEALPAQPDVVMGGDDAPADG